MQDQGQNPYQPPSTNSINTESVELGTKRTIEQALASGYDFSIGDIISKAWQQVNGVKLTFFLAFLIIFAISFVIGLILGFLPPKIGGPLNFFVNIAINALSAGFIVLALKRLRGQQINLKEDFFSILPIFSVIILACLLTTLLTSIGMLLLLIPGIYLAVAYCLTSWIIVDNPGVSAWQAMEASRKIITQRWFKVFGLMIVLGIIVGISAIPFGIGLIWTFPLLMLSIGTLYRTIFEV
ncbi:DUF975 family protein [Entomomonas asaccharolytica]|uniref:Integral membrane protein n=1 Tax=Entomomonas asaccharolytica TaxID=2785331 RepID=A0A974RXM9_9GAMM|nr:hypothetical protein [Entomomonas asaccharolytica]QQP86360.1 hypothetical protein JHT90_03715 [Entomomonas asaccharolytica]